MGALIMWVHTFWEHAVVRLHMGRTRTTFCCISGQLQLVFLSASLPCQQVFLKTFAVMIYAIKILQKKEKSACRRIQS